MEEWSTLKPKFDPWCRLPVLQIGEEKIFQSRAICRFIGGRYGLCPKDGMISARCDEIVDAASDAFDEFAAFTYQEQDKVKGEEMKKQFEKSTLKKFLSRASKFQEQHGNSWFVGNEMTWADVLVAEYIRQMCKENPKALEKFPNIKSIQDTVFSMPKIQRYRESRKK